MTKVINAYTGLCKNCHKCEQIHSLTDDDSEIAVCYACGKVEFKNEFDALKFITELIEDGIEKEDEITEVLTSKLSDHYGYLDFVDEVTLAALLVKSLYDEAVFRAGANKQEARDYYRSREMDLADAREGRW